ncbi:hypothetical protein BD779DRAFT_1497109 [Infundibulicybe gibba]|nr:hypothetical protein BD779DRAFT_1497109 [Infundibulicybe gibba]
MTELVRINDFELSEPMTEVRNILEEHFKAPPICPSSPFPEIAAETPPYEAWVPGDELTNRPSSPIEFSLKGFRMSQCLGSPPKYADWGVDGWVGSPANEFNFDNYERMVAAIDGTGPQEASRNRIGLSGHTPGWKMSRYMHLEKFEKYRNSGLMSRLAGRTRPFAHQDAESISSMVPSLPGSDEIYMVLHKDASGSGAMCCSVEELFGPTSNEAESHDGHQYRDQSALSDDDSDNIYEGGSEEYDDSYGSSDAECYDSCGGGDANRDYDDSCESGEAADDDSDGGGEVEYEASYEDSDVEYDDPYQGGSAKWDHLYEGSSSEWDGSNDTFDDSGDEDYVFSGQRPILPRQLRLSRDRTRSTPQVRSSSSSPSPRTPSRSIPSQRHFHQTESPMWSPSSSCSPSSQTSADSELLPLYLRPAGTRDLSSSPLSSCPPSP